MFCGGGEVGKEGEKLKTEGTKAGSRREK